MSVAKGVFVGFRRIGVVMVILATVWPAAAANAVPLLAQAGQALVAPGLENAAKPVNAAANAPAAAAPAAAPATATAAAAGGATNTLIKYAPSYVLMGLFVGLGTFIICRPRWGTVAKTAGKTAAK